MFVKVLVRTNVRAPSTSAVVWLSLVFIRRTVRPYDVKPPLIVEGPWDIRFIVMNRSGPGDMDRSCISVLTRAMVVRHRRSSEVRAVRMGRSSAQIYTLIKHDKLKCLYGAQDVATASPSSHHQRPFIPSLICCTN